VGGGNNGNRATGANSAVGAGSRNQALNQFASILGGNSNTVLGLAGTLGGGDSNGILTGGDYAVLTGGKGNLLSGLGDVIAGGLSNLVSASYATIGGGQSNAVTKVGATVPGGQLAVADQCGELAYANGGFSGVPGSAQYGLAVLRGQVTFAGGSGTLTLDGNGCNLTLQANSAWLVRGTVVANAAGNVARAWSFETLVRNGAGATVLSQSQSTIGYDPAAATWTMSVGTSGSSLTLTGSASVASDWVATVQITQVQ